MNNRKNMRIGVLSLGGMLFLLLSSWNNGVGASSYETVRTYIGKSGSEGLTEVWNIIERDGQVTVCGAWFEGQVSRSSIAKGYFNGEGYGRNAEGQLSFKQQITLSPVDGWRSGNTLTILSMDEKYLKVRWQLPNNGASGDLTHSRTKYIGFACD